jgi:hypothetical protein
MKTEAIRNLKSVVWLEAMKVDHLQVIHRALHRVLYSIEPKPDADAGHETLQMLTE